MRPNGDVDFDCLRALVDWHVESGTAAIVSVGTTGESATLSVKEHLEVISATIEAAGERIPVLAGTGGNATAEAKVLTREAAQAGARACLLVTPYYNRPPQEGLFRHFAAVAEFCDIPLILYNVPARTGCDLLPTTVARLLSYGNIVGIKEAKGNFERIDELLALSDDFVVYTGDDATACESMLRGVRGDISVTANIAPAKMQQMCLAAIAGDAERAKQLDAELAGLHNKLFIEPNPIPVKWALARMGRSEHGIRLPMTPLAEEFKADVEQAMIQAGVEL